MFVKPQKSRKTYINYTLAYGHAHLLYVSTLYSIRRELTSVRPRLRPCPFLGRVASPRSAHATFAAASPGACRLRPVVSPPQPEGALRAPARDASDLALARARDAPLSDGGQRRRGARRLQVYSHWDMGTQQLVTLLSSSGKKSYASTGWESHFSACLPARFFQSNCQLVNL